MENRAVYCMNLKDNRDGSTAESSQKKFDFCLQKQIIGIGWVADNAEEKEPSHINAEKCMTSLETGDLIWIKEPWKNKYYIAEVLDGSPDVNSDNAFAENDLSICRNCKFYEVGQIPHEYIDYLKRLVTPKTIQSREDQELIDAVNTLWESAKNYDETPAKDTAIIIRKFLKKHKKIFIILLCIIAAIIAFSVVRGVVHNIRTSNIEQEMNAKLEGKTFLYYYSDGSEIEVYIMSSDGLYDCKTYEIDEDNNGRWKLSDYKSEGKLEYYYSDWGELTRIDYWGALQLDSNGNPVKIGDRTLATEEELSMIKKADERELTKHKLSDFMMTIDEYREAYKSSGLPVTKDKIDLPVESLCIPYKNELTGCWFMAIDDSVNSDESTFRLSSGSPQGVLLGDDYLLKHILLYLKNIPGALTTTDEIVEHWNAAEEQHSTVRYELITKEFTYNGITYSKVTEDGKDGEEIHVSVNRDYVVYLADYPEFDVEQATDVTSNGSAEDHPNNGGISTGGDTSTGQTPTSENTSDSKTETSNSNNAYNNSTPNGSSDGAGNSNSNNTSYNPCANGHTWSEATCESPATCSVCGQVSGGANGHQWIDATCTSPATCSVCGQTSGSAKGHSWNEATCSSPKKCQVCKTTEGSALPHDMHYTKCTMCDYADFSNYTLSSNTFCLDSWFYLGNGSKSQYLKDGEASINIDKNGVCKVEFDKYSYTFTLVQSGVDVYGLHFVCYMNGEYVKNTEVTFYFSQNRCGFSNYDGTLGFSQVALNFDM